ncbi:Co2+/Mg2+ efflux protein ApaG [Halioglobus japonicus]|uniref:Protein ApaG n=1 Tax=Halioglobus japonicus TaxID=930805 RepID=A0AAP8MCA5_9GAMM|nr:MULTISPECIES: Co2+/Mg2+ efflux protein ApaG [Halioglobus]AQA17046.1 Co2+/Mg2+ efflux protein ApaG [Halioglobus japonicus]KZX58384.1 Co2+/Mg2+ efflux protein ApaG [Halioglobus sp. HI00S01]PLW84952.1 Co2+/Mg2+ efflux protein ApaG [Halioglobus japonicus]GHD18697.1 protein ApaG [Halioglobus japonicus]
MPNAPFKTSLIGINVVTTYLPSHSSPDEDHYTFAYTITISNASDSPVQLLSRHWVITDANNEVQEVRGEGVVGEQPVIPPGDSFRYTSGASLETPVGFMEGSYFMVVRDPMEVPPEDLPTFEVPIPAFTLHTPTALN